ncbi:MAG: carbohydrate porin, partial [Rhodoplanes sp.]
MAESNLARSDSAFSSRSLISIWKSPGLDSDIGFFSNSFYPVRSGETVVEMMYQAQLAPWWMVQPEVQ